MMKMSRRSFQYVLSVSTANNLLTLNNLPECGTFEPCRQETGRCSQSTCRHMDEPDPTWCLDGVWITSLTVLWKLWDKTNTQQRSIVAAAQTNLDASKHGSGERRRTRSLVKRRPRQENKERSIKVSKTSHPSSNPVQEKFCAEEQYSNDNRKSDFCSQKVIICGKESNFHCWRAIFFLSWEANFVSKSNLKCHPGMWKILFSVDRQKSHFVMPLPLVVALIPHPGAL